MKPVSLSVGKYLSLTSPFIRFLCVGCLNTLVGLSTSFILLNGFGLTYWFATFLGNGVGAICSFVLNRNFTFQSNAAIKKTGVLFVFVVLFCYWFSYSLSAMVAEAFTLTGILTKKEQAVLIGTVIYTITNYCAQKYIVFSK
ncbi:GtrA family protein [Robertmurraya sp. FSL W8-0741]|uniref:GtrA family protein n=1 Tax=Robertmurraya TaxID=2837507 RepID=UPI000BA52A16|nr:GtrA family protein [Robertmurraya siralis]PAE22481.1 polysaccharide biosynthesis protein GtrA [Bacillus sp. 7504-2]